VVLASVGSGIVQGAIIALMALGFTVIFQATAVVNFANGPMMVLGANFGFEAYVHLHWPFALAVGLSMVAGALIGIGADILVIGPLRRADLLMQVMALVALSLVLNGVVQHAFGATPRTLPAFAPTVAAVKYVRWSVTDVIILGVTAIAVCAITVFNNRTAAGLAMRATASDREGAELVGISPTRVALLAWAAGGALTALAGTLVLPQTALVPGIGDTYTFLAFAAVVLGGFGSVPGAVIGGLTIGVADALVSQFIASGYEPLVSLVIMAAILVVRPSGLLGRQPA
jgi:branched-chain amino acid transport system permease protein